MKILHKSFMVIHKICDAIGILTMAFVAFAVIFTVVMRYFFNISFSFLEELITVVFTFNVFWVSALCILEKEHVILDFFYNTFPAKAKRIIDVFNDIVMIISLGMLDKYSIDWITKAGKTLTNGMRVKYGYLYITMPIGFTLIIICCIYKLICDIRGERMATLKKEE